MIIMMKKSLYTPPVCEIIEIDLCGSVMELVLSVYDEESEIIGANENSLFDDEENDPHPYRFDQLWEENDDNQ